MEEMEEMEVIRKSYLDLRDAIASWVRDQLDGKAWYYQPTPLSNPAAWIVGHLIAFEQEYVYDQIPGYSFPRGATAEVVERYRPGVAGYAMGEKSLMSAREALAGLARLRGITDRFLRELLSGAAAAKAVDQGQVRDAYQHNFTHDTEHFGQLKYLTGTWGRMQGPPREVLTPG